MSKLWILVFGNTPAKAGIIALMGCSLLYCRPICPAVTAKEHNVTYYQYAHSAAQAGFRPCIRCRPDSAPGSSAWQGVKTSALRAKQLIDNNLTEPQSASQLAQRLGISSRYLRRLFSQHFGISVTQYRLFSQCHFAKKLLQETTLPISQIAFSSGFKSIRRFNDAFLQQLHICPTKMRLMHKSDTSTLTLKLPFRPPYNWHALHQFLARRLISPMEWLTQSSYGRCFNNDYCKGQFTATFIEDKHHFLVSINIDDPLFLQPILVQIRRVLDLDADTNLIEQHLEQSTQKAIILTKGLRLPGIWSSFEAGIRAVLGQQVSVTAAHNLVGQLVNELGECDKGRVYFPTPQIIAKDELTFFKMPQARKNALRNLSQYVMDNPDCEQLDNWLELKGIGPWTVNYAKLRGQSQPDILLAGDLGVKKAQMQAAQFNSDSCRPFRSYLTFQLWQQLL